MYKYLIKFLIIVVNVVTITVSYGHQKNIYKHNTPYLTNDLLKKSLKIIAFRHKILSQNIANINTPGYKANEVIVPREYRDLMKNTNNKIRRINLKRTSDKHMTIRNSSSNQELSTYKIQDPYEINPNGNNVSLEQQMVKISQNQHDYNFALKNFTTINSLITLVLGNHK